MHEGDVRKVPFGERFWRKSLDSLSSYQSSVQGSCKAPYISAEKTFILLFLISINHKKRKSKCFGSFDEQELPTFSAPSTPTTTAMALQKSHSSRTRRITQVDKDLFMSRSNFYLGCIKVRWMKKIAVIVSDSSEHMN